MKARFAEQAGVSAAVGTALLVVAAYSLWGAAILGAHRQAATETSATHLSTSR